MADPARDPAQSSDRASDPGPAPAPFRRHVLVCVGPSCTDRGSADVREALRCELLRCGLDRDVRTTKCQCLDLCNHGPNVVVYPEGIWYENVRPRDVAEIVERHLGGGVPVERLRHDWSRPEIGDDETFLL